MSDAYKSHLYPSCLFILVSCRYEWCCVRPYGVATMSRLLKMIGLFCRISSLYRALLQKRLIILRSLLIVAGPYSHLTQTGMYTYKYIYKYVYIQ